MKNHLISLRETSKFDEVKFGEVDCIVNVLELLNQYILIVSIVVDTMRISMCHHHHPSSRNFEKKPFASQVDVPI